MRLLQLTFSGIGIEDWFALAWFILCWAGYGYFADRSRKAQHGLLGASQQYRLAWARETLKRDNRITDASLIGNLMSSVSFYANTTIYIVAGLVAAIGALDKLISATADLPLAREVSREVWEMKLVLLLAVFVVAYFKFTWSIRQFNFLSLMLGGAPPPGEDEATAERYAQKMARLNKLAGDEFNRGIRAYYFGLAAVSWMIQPWVFVAVTTLVVGVLYRRDYASATLATLRD